MELMNLLKEKQLSVYQCAKESHVPYTTLSDIVKGTLYLHNHYTMEVHFPCLSNQPQPKNKNSPDTIAVPNKSLFDSLSEIVKGKTRIEKCTAETIYKLARTLHLTMEELLTECVKKDENFPCLNNLPQPEDKNFPDTIAVPNKSLFDSLLKYQERTMFKRSDSRISEV